MSENVPEISVDDLSELLESAPVVIDVREPDEYREARVPGVRLVPLATIPQALEGLPDGPLYVICRSGARSSRAAEFLRANGKEAINVAGGTMAWISAGFDYETGE